MAEQGLSAELLGCPNPWCSTTTAPLSAKGIIGWRVICGCGVQTHARPDRAQAVALWNTRSPPPVDEGVREKVVERICIGLFADYDDLTLECAERNWRAGFAYGAVGSDGHRYIMITANLIADSLALIASSPSGWRTIDSAPKDGTAILAFCVHANARYAGEDMADWSEIVTTRWIDFNGGGWTWNGICGVHTHWQPLPPPPVSGRAEP